MKYSHTLTAEDGAQILESVIVHLYNFTDEADQNGTALIMCGPVTPCEFCLSIQTCRKKLSEIINENI